MAALNNFKNILDKDIQIFLNEKAVSFEEREWCSTYLLINRDELEHRKIKIEAYFTLSHQILRFSDSVSKNKKKKLGNGIIPRDNAVPVILIGQLGKYISKEKKSSISMEEILSLAENIILSVKEKIVCSLVLVECKINNVKLIDKYQKNGFFLLQESDGFVQLIKKI